MLSIFLSVLLAQAAAPAAAEVSGDVVLSCRVAEQGVLQDCKAVRETPEGRGFGPAAARKARTMRVPSRVGRTVNVPVPLRFTAAEADANGILPEGSAPLVQGAEWLERPGGKEFATYYPEQARRRGLAGYSLVRCTVAANGDLEQCRVLQETPAGAGFGDQATKLAEAFFRIGPTDETGRRTAGRPVNLPITWMLGQ